MDIMWKWLTYFTNESRDFGYQFAYTFTLLTILELFKADILFNSKRVWDYSHLFILENQIIHKVGPKKRKIKKNNEED